ncbi:TPA: hypothetical protein N0H64_001602 [Pseudomonas aeruginosa]|nr:hypothetical protein [Pseudomonas aeruginosa]
MDEAKSEYSDNNTVRYLLMGRVIVRNSDGVVVIDDSYVNSAVAARGTVTPSASTTFVYPAATISYIPRRPDSLPMIAVSMTGAFYVAKTEVASGRVTWTVVSVSGTPISYFIFDDPPDGAAKGSLVVRNKTTGRVTFDSDLDYLRVVGTYTMQRSEDYKSFSLLPGKEYAVISLVTAYKVYQSQVNPPNGGLWLWGMDSSTAEIRSNTLYIKLIGIAVRTVTGPTTTSIYRGGDAVVMVIDVTGF